MRTFIILTIAWFIALSAAQGTMPDLTKAEDLAKLGIGKIIEKDNCITKRITLKEIKDNFIIYVKDESLHDKHMSYIKYLDFPESKWGHLKIEFIDTKPQVSFLPY